MATSTIDLALTRLQKATVHITDLNKDGDVDTTTPLTALLTDSAAVATIAADPADSRAVVVTATGTQFGPVQCHVSCGSNTLAINVTVSDVDLSAISATADAPVHK